MSLDRRVGLDSPSELPSDTGADLDAGHTVRVERLPHWREMVAGGLLLALLLALLRLAASPIANTDTYFHLQFGHEFLHGWSLRHPGSVSTFATAPWLPTQWLPEIVMAQVQSWFGLAGVAWLLGLVLLSLLATLYLSARRWSTPLPAAVLAALALFVSGVNLSLRPQMLSFLLVAVTTAAWLRTRDDHRVRWWLIPLTWLWAMCHGMWPIGVALGLVAVLGLALDRTLPKALLLRVVSVPVGSAVAAALTPLGPALYGTLFAVNDRKQYFSEWASPDFTNPECVTLGLLLATAAVLMVRRANRSWLDLLMLLAAGGCAVWSWRTVPVAAMVLVPLIAVQVGARGERRSKPPGRGERLLVLGVGVLAMTALAFTVPQTADDPPPQPAWVDPTLSALPAGTKVLDSWDYGGYLMWRYPQLDLLIHGYGDTFTIAELQRNADILDLAPHWDDELKATGCDVAILRPTSSLAYALVTEKDWTVVHSSPGIAELRAPHDW